MPDDHESPAELTNQELKAAIERTPAKTRGWRALIEEARTRPSFRSEWFPPDALTTPGDHGSLTDLQLKEAIGRILVVWNELIHEAITRRSFPHSWLPTGVVFSEYTDMSHHGNQG